MSTSPEITKIALVGCGRVAAKHLKAIRYQEKRMRARLVAVADRNPEAARVNLRAGYSRSQQLPLYNSLTELLVKEEVDLVAITTPSGTHKDLALEALAAGKHLLVEKPLAMNLEDARLVQKQAERAGLKLALGHIYRYFPVMQILQQDLASGRFGRIYYGSVLVRWGHDQAYYDASPWRGTRAADGGVILNQSVHALDLMRWLLGVEDKAILSCEAQAARQSHKMESEDLGLGIFHFAGGVRLLYEGSTSPDPDYQEAGLFICSEKADIRAGLRAKKPYLSVRQGKRDYGGAYLRRFLQAQLRREGFGSLTSLANPHTAIYTDLLTAIAEDRQPLADAAAGVSSLAMVEALYRASGIISDGEDRPVG